MDENEALKKESASEAELASADDDDDVNQGSGAPAPKDMKHLDFVTSLVVLGVSIFVLHYSQGLFQRSLREEFYASPGFMPTIIAVALLLLGLKLLSQSLSKTSLKEIFGRLLEATPRGLKSARFKNTVAGLAIFALYIFVFLRYLPFWLASILVLFGCFMYLKAAKPLKSAIIAITSAVGIVLLFQEVFRVPMP